MSRAENWYVVTGGPSSGKTSTLKDLDDRGYRVEPEVARTYIEREFELGRELTEIRADEEAFQLAVLREKIDHEAGLPGDEVVFLDRGIHDSIAYLQLHGFTVNEEVAKAAAAAAYQKVFLLQLGEDYVVDHARTEDLAEARRLEQPLLERAYASYGLPVIILPWEPISVRTERILDHLR